MLTSEPINDSNYLNQTERLLEHVKGNWMKRIPLILLLWILFFLNLQGQSNRSGTLSGFVYDAADKEALIGVNIYLPDLELGASTNVSGYFIIPQIPAGTHTVVCDYLGYRTIVEEITIDSGENKVFDFTLTMETIEGQAVEVVADSIRVSEQLYNKPISNIQLSPRQINTIPQVAEADLLRALQTLPGILPLSDFSSALYVRGGTPDQNLYLLDGTDVYNPEHAFGIFSTFNTDAVKHVEISKGGFSAAYGGRLSSVLDVINLDGNREEFEGSAQISLLSAKTTLQMPIGNIGAISGSARRTYFDKTIGPSIDDIPDYYFYDGNLKAFIDLDPKNKITASLYGGQDVLNVIFNENSSDQAGFDLKWGNTTGSLKWTRVFNPQLFANFWLTGSRFESKFDFGETVAVAEKNFVSDVTVKGNLEYHYSQKFQMEFGFEQKNLHVQYRQTFPGGTVNVDKKPRHYVGYLQTNWRPTPRWDIQAGVRYNLFDSEKTFQDWEPRFSAKYRLTNTVNIKAATGIYHQYLHRIARPFFSDIWSASNRFQDQSRSNHFIFGIQKEIATNYQFEIEGYVKEYKNLYAFNETFLTELTADEFDANGDPVYTETKDIFNNGDGNSFGFELLMRKDKGTITGWIGYSYAETEYDFPAINEGLGFFPRHDRRSTVNIVNNIDIRNALRSWKGKANKTDRSRWTFGANFVYSSGQPITAAGSGYITGPAPNAVQRYVEYYPGEINAFRLPAYARLDLSLTWKKFYSGWTMAPYLQIYNIGNRKNVWFIDYEYNNGIPDIKETNMFPILPTIGVNFTF